MRAYFEFVLWRRAVVLLGFAALTAVAGWSLSRGVLASSMARSLGESPAYQEYLKDVDHFGSDEVILIGVEVADPLAPEVRTRLQQAIEAIEQDPVIARVHHPLDAQRIALEDGALKVKSYGDLAERHPEQTTALTAEMRADPLIGRTLVARDGSGIVLAVELVPDPNRKAEAGPALLAEILTDLEAAGFPRAQLHAAGQIASLSEILIQTRISIRTIFPFTAALLLLTVWLLFHRLWPALLSMGVSLFAVVYTMGFAVQLDPEISVMMAIVPSVILIVAFSDVVHLCSAYLIELGRGVDKHTAILAAAEDVGRACVYTSLTTFIGFMSLSLVPTPVFRLFGFVTGFGVAIALLIAMTLIPVLFSLLPAPKPLREGATSRVQRGLDRVLGFTRRLAMEHPWPVIAVFGLATVAAGIGSLGLRIETDMIARLEPDNPAAMDHQWFLDRFAGNNLVDVYVSAPDVDGLLDPQRFAALAEWQTAVEALPGVDEAMSLVDLLQRMHEVLTSDQPDAPPRPTTREQLAQYLLLFEMSGGEDLDRLVDFDRRRMRVQLRLRSDGFMASVNGGNAAAALLGERLHDGTVAKATGISYLLGDWLDDVFDGQKRGLGLSVLTIGLMMMIAVRSIGAGLASMVPNILPLLALTGWVGATMPHVDSDVFIVLVIAIGIGVDDTIHFLVRLRTERQRGADRREAIRATYDFAGRAILMTTLILAVGFAPFALSDYLSTRILGTMLPACLIVAVLADLLLVPAMAAVGWIRFRTPST